MHWTLSPSRIAQLGLLALVAIAATVVSVAAATGGGGGEARTQQTSWSGLVGGPRPEVAVGQRMIVVLRTPSLADRVAGAGGLASEAQHERWHNAALAAQQQLIAQLGASGLRLRPEFSYTRVLSGFSAPLDARAIALLQRFPEVEGVYPVRTAYPASLSSSATGVSRLARKSSTLRSIPETRRASVASASALSLSICTARLACFITLACVSGPGTHP